MLFNKVIVDYYCLFAIIQALFIIFWGICGCNSKKDFWKIDFYWMYEEKNPIHNCQLDKILPSEYIPKSIIQK